MGVFFVSGGTAYADCGSPANAIEAENCLTGNPPSEWDVRGAGDPNLQGFATDISVNRGQTVSFKVDTIAAAYRIDIYRLGYYGGNGARKVATLSNAATTKTNQPACVTQTTGLVDCGNWSVSASWAVPSTAVSGIYIARLVGEAGGVGASHMVFIVRHDGGTSRLLFQTSDTTWHAHNRYGGAHLDGGTGPGTGLAGVGRAYKVSYNRPFTTRSDAPEDWIFNAEYPMVRWLERNGYDVSYSTGVDTDRRGGEILNHKVFLSVGHDEYWSGPQRANVEAARDHTPPVHLAFFSANEISGKTRKQAPEGARIDPLTVNGVRNDMLEVPEADGKMRFWRDTPNVANLGASQVWTAPSGTLGYEWDEDLDNGLRPAGLVRLSTTTIDGSTDAPGTATHHLVFHKRSNGGLVFGAGTGQWPWGLDRNHDRGSAAPSVDMQQATVNLFADMGVQPASLQADLLPASASADVVAPASDITFPAPGAALPASTAVTILGTATDGSPGLVGGVEVSVDGGATWHPAAGRATWSYLWTPASNGTTTILSRAVDDSGNLEAPGAGRTVTVGGGATGVSDVAGHPLADDTARLVTTQATPPTEGPGGPILVIASPANPFSRYYAEILRAEGLNAFAVLDISAVDATVLAGYDLAILGEMSLTPSQVTTLTTWVNGGGNLIAMRPDKQLAGLLGLTDAGTTLTNTYLLVNTAASPGQGIVGQTMQFHGTADRYTLAAVTPAAVRVATLYSTATTATTSAAVSLRTVGSGEAAAFAFDLARSIVYTRQGNPAWAGQKRDGEAGPTRSDDLFYGAKAGDVQPDWVNLGKVAIPQADEQQRLLANLILKMNADRKPLPRFWYFPRGEKAVVIMAVDNHGNQTVEARLAAEEAASPAGCSVADWECIRSTVYLYTSALPDDSTAKQWEDAGLRGRPPRQHGLRGLDPASLADFYTGQIANFFSTFPSLAPLLTHRTHCIAWSDWATQPQVELENGIRLDANYYYWPPGWVNNTPGFFTGSGMPMRFAGLDGTMIDVYQATTQMTDESGQTYPFTINTLLDRAIGTEGYYGAFVANIHSDGSTESQAAAIVSSAQARSVPVVTAKQMLTWIDGRNGSSFTGITWSAGVLTFGVAVDAGANGLQAMVPTQNGASTLTALTRDGVALPHTTQTIKGISYAVFAAQPGTHRASYGGGFTLTVTAPTQGRITGTGINCGTGGSDCSEAYASGTVVPLTATPDTGYSLSAWTGACSGAGACSVTMDADKTVGATFAILRYTLTVTAPTHGTITGTGISCGTGGVDCTEIYDYGTAVPLTPTPDANYNLGGWTGACSGTGACSVTMTAARTVGATFTIQRYTLTVTAPTNGTITATGITCGTGGVDCTEIYDYGTVVPLTATPATGYDFGGWTGACSGTGACSVTMTAARTVGATFTIQRYTLTVTAPTLGTITGTGIACGTGGVDCTEVFDYGTVVPLTATPDTGYSLSAWTGACSGTGACSVAMTAARAVGATFAVQRLTLTVAAPANGTITGTGITCGTGGSDCTETFDYGTVVPLTATPATGYDFGGWTGACSGTGACSATMTAARTVGATFTIQRYTLTVTAPTLGTITGTGINCGTGGVDCTEIYDYGTVVPLTATPNTGYSLSAWTGACTGTGACSVAMTAARTVGATFASSATPSP